MHRVWKKFIRNHRGKFSAELKLKTDFPVRIGFCFARRIYFLYRYKWIPDYYIMEAGAGKQFMRILYYGEPPYASRSSEGV